MTKDRAFIAGCWEATNSNEVREKLELLLRSAAAVWPELGDYEIRSKKNTRPNTKVERKYDRIEAEAAMRDGKLSILSGG